jgi:hypothetical protein
MIPMVVDEALTLDEAYKETVAGLEKLGWKDLHLDSGRRGINASFEGEKDIWELLIHFQKKGKFEISSRSKWKVRNNTSDLVQHLVEKINQNNSKHDFRMNDNGSFEVNTSADILERYVFIDGMKRAMINNIKAYESYASMVKRFVNIGPEYLEKETEGFRALVNSKFESIDNQEEQLIRLDLQK